MRTKLPDLFHYKYAHDYNFTDEENAIFEQNPDNYYVYDSFMISEMTEDSDIWKLESFTGDNAFSEYSEKYVEIQFYYEGRSVMKTAAGKTEISGIEIGQVHGIEKLTQKMVDMVLKQE